MTDTILDLIRHGEPVGGRAFRGNSIDDPLSDKGWQQMRDAVGDSCPWIHIISSPLQRCVAFANELASKHGLAVSVDARLQEVGFGQWEGKTPDELRRDQPDAYNAFYTDPLKHRPPGAEDLSIFSARVIAAYQELCECYRGQQLLVVAHAGVIRAMIAHVLLAEPAGMYRIKVDYASISRIRITQRGAMLEYQNHT
jgi:probable phosphoglycerate mutase